MGLSGSQVAARPVFPAFTLTLQQRCYNMWRRVPSAESVAALLFHPSWLRLLNARVVTFCGCRRLVDADFVGWALRLGKVAGARDKNMAVEPTYRQSVQINIETV